MTMTRTAQAQVLEVFVCAADDDRRLVDQLCDHAVQLQQQGRMILRHRGTLAPGAHLLKENATALERAHVVLLLLSPALFIDRDIMAVLLPLVIARAAAGHLRVLLVLGRHCMWQAHPDLVGRDLLPNDGQALVALLTPRRDQEMISIIKAVLGLDSQSRSSNLPADASFAQFLEEANVLEHAWLSPNENVELVRDWADTLLDVASASELVSASAISKARRVKKVSLKIYDTKSEQENSRRVARFIDGIKERLSGATLAHREGRRRPLSIEEVMERLERPLQRKQARGQLNGLKDALWKLQAFQICRQPAGTFSGSSPPTGLVPTLYLGYVPADAATAHQIASFLEAKGIRCSRHELSESAGQVSFDMLRLRTHLVLLWSPNAARTASLGSKIGLAVVAAAYQSSPSVVVVMEGAELPGPLRGVKYMNLRSGDNLASLMQFSIAL